MGMGHWQHQGLPPAARLQRLSAPSPPVLGGSGTLGWDLGHLSSDVLGL